MLPSLILNGMQELVSKTTLFQEAHTVLFQSPTVSWLRLVHVEFPGVAGTANKVKSYSPFLCAVFKRKSLFSCGAPPSRPAAKTQLMKVPFALLERVVLRSQKKGVLGRNIVWGAQGERKEKRTRKQKVAYVRKFLHPPRK